MEDLYSGLPQSSPLSRNIPPRCHHLIVTASVKYIGSTLTQQSLGHDFDKYEKNIVLGSKVHGHHFVHHPHHLVWHIHFEI